MVWYVDHTRSLLYEKKNTPAVTWMILPKLFFASCVCDTALCVRVNDSDTTFPIVGYLQGEISHTKSSKCSSRVYVALLRAEGAGRGGNKREKVITWCKIVQHINM